MNYYPFNLGDYAAHTGHLEPMEDLAYRRLLDLYYMRESALPADVEATAKLIRLRSCLGDVKSVLEEFFDLTSAGWIHARCEEEIAKMRDKQAKARASGKASANVRRANAERSLLENITDVERTLGEIPTNVQLPIPTPIPIDIYPAPSASGLACKAMKEAGVTGVNPSHPDVKKLVEAGVTAEEFRDAAAEAVSRNRGNLAYVLAMLKSRLQEAAKEGPLPQAQRNDWTRDAV